MNRQTEDYISLKPIADRFKDAANSITDDEIRNMIKNSLQRQIDEQLDLGLDALGYHVTDIIDNWFDDCNNENFVITLIENGLKKNLIEVSNMELTKEQAIEEQLKQPTVAEVVKTAEKEPEIPDSMKQEEM